MPRITLFCLLYKHTHGIKDLVERIFQCFVVIVEIKQSLMEARQKERKKKTSGSNLKKKKTKS